MSLGNKSGIYRILCTVNGKFYIGSALNLQRRKNDHLKRLRKGNHGNSYLQNIYNKYGEDSLLWEVLENCTDPSTILLREQLWIDKTDCCDKSIGLNFCPTAGNTAGKKHTEISKGKMKASHQGKKHTEETKQKMSLARTGLLHTEETKQKIRDFYKENPIKNGFKHTEETKSKMSASKKGNTNCLGYKHTEETRRKMGESRIGKKNALGHKHSEETKAKLRESSKGNRYNSKLNWELVNEIRTSEETAPEIAERMKVSKSQIYDIRSNKAWKV